jgi:hypothetical protein
LSTTRERPARPVARRVLVEPAHLDPEERREAIAARPADGEARTTPAMEV